MSFKRTGISLALGLLVLGIGFTFFNKKSVNDGELESQLKNQIATQQHLSVDKVSVACPSSEELKEGTTFDCTATVDGRDLVLAIKLTSDQGDYVLDSVSKDGA
jgi:hypothetical protein